MKGDQGVGVGDDEQQVVYPLTVVLGRIEEHVAALGTQFAARFDRLEAKLDLKADRADVTEMDKRLTAADQGLDHRVTSLETAEERRREGSRVAREHERDSTESRRSFWALVLAAVAAVAAIALAVAQFIPHG